MRDCVFCKIIKKEVDSKIVFEDQELIAFHDIHPQAPIHILILPKQHIDTLNAVQENQINLVGKMLYQAAGLARQYNVSTGYNTVINCGEAAGQTVFHLHMHLLAGQMLKLTPQ